MAAFTNWLATALTAAAIVYYDLVYTLWLKRTTPQNTFWGGVCGAAPVLIGWAAVTGSLAPAGVGAVRGRLLLADAALLRAGDQVQGRLRPGRHPDAAGGGSPRRVNAEIGDLRVAHRGRLAGALAAGAEPDLRRAARWWSAPSSWSRRTGWYGRSRRGEPLKPMRLFHWSTTYLTILFVAVAVDALI